MKLLFTCNLIATTLITNYIYKNNELKKSIKRGKEIYTDFCINCHLEKGEGLKNIVPPLAKSDYLSTNKEETIRGLKFGQKGELLVNGIVYNGEMPAMGLENDEIADVMNYILNSWGNSSKEMVTPGEVATITTK